MSRSALPPRHALALALCLALLACRSAPTAHHGTTSKLGSAPLAPCPALPTGAEPLVEPGATVVLGETHGTNEVPAFVATLVCDAAQRSSVLVGLELLAASTPTLQTYVASAGTDADRRALLDLEFWQAQDGRASEAMFELVEALRTLRERGKIVEVFAFDGDFATAEERDRGMARAVVSALRSDPDPGRVAFVLTGNLHARIDTDRWMAWHVRDAIPETVALTASFRGGEAWVCTPDCGATELPGRPSEGSRPFVELGGDLDGRWDGRFYLDVATVSVPLRSVADAPSRGGDSADTRQRAKTAYDAGDGEQCETLYLAVAQAGPAEGRVRDYFDAARCAAMSGRIDAAFAALDSSVSLGLHDFARVKTEADLRVLHTDPRWQAILAGVRANDAEPTAPGTPPPGP